MDIEAHGVGWLAYGTTDRTGHLALSWFHGFLHECCIPPERNRRSLSLHGTMAMAEWTVLVGKGDQAMQ